MLQDTGTFRNRWMRVSRMSASRLFSYLRSLQLFPQFVQVRDESVLVGVRLVDDRLQLLEFVLVVLVLGLRALQLGAEPVDFCLRFFYLK